MMKKAAPVDGIFALLLGILVAGGSLVFASAAFGLLARGNANIPSVVFSHVVLGIGIGMILMLIAALIDYRELRRYAPYIFAATLVLTAAVFLPYIGMEHGGGRRWLHISRFTLQPSEFLKIGVVVMMAAYCAMMKGKISTLKYGLGGYIAVLALPVLLLVAQPDLGTLGVMIFSTLAVFWAAGARFRDLALLVLIGLISLGLLATFRPYVRDRVVTFFYPSHNQHDEGYQIRQSLIAIGSGGIMGRGLGQGVQKFTYLPEPMGDSIFAVAGEEFGFVGGTIIIGLFTAFGIRGLRIASRAPDLFGKYLAVGLSFYLVIEAFLNIAAMLALAPLTGIPLTFVSQGGSAMLAALAAAGILLGISRARGPRATA